MKVAEVIRPSQPSFCTPGKPLKNLSVTSFPSPIFLNLFPGISRISFAFISFDVNGSRKDISNFAKSI